MKIKEFEKLLQFCKELEITTLGELARFKAEEQKGNLLIVMARYIQFIKRVGE